MMDQTLFKSDLFASLPSPWPENLFPDIRKTVTKAKTKLVILDDDPTGTQTVHGMPVITNWSIPALAAELNNVAPGFFVLTNSRSITRPAAVALNKEIGAKLRQAVSSTGISVEVISRSDSTLRGHFPSEVDALLEGMGSPSLPRILIPCFFEGGRLTANDIHYVTEGDKLIPAALTPYAKDAVFGYRCSNLRHWVAEKTGGALSVDQVASITIDDIRKGGPGRVNEKLHALPPFSCCIVNAVEYSDLNVFVAGLLASEALGYQFLIRSGASFVRSRAGVSRKALLEGKELTVSSGRGGLFVIGSYVPKTNSQLAALGQRKNVVNIEVKAELLFDDALQSNAIETAIASANRALKRGLDVALFTSRDIVVGSDEWSSLNINQRISDSLIAIVRGIDCRPSYIVAKGGITSSDIATKGLSVHRAMVIGQVLPGVPVWRLGRETRWPGMTYIVFPGNVGDDDALVTIQRLMKMSDQD